MSLHIAGAALGCVVALVATGSCSIQSDDPGIVALEQERQRLLNISKLDASELPDVQAVRKRLQEAGEPLLTQLSGFDSHETVTKAVVFCGGSLHEISSGPPEPQLGSEPRQLFARFTSLRVDTPVCVIERLVRGASLTFVDTFECTQQRQTIGCAFALNTIRFLDTPPPDPELQSPPTDTGVELLEQVQSLREQTAEVRQTLAIARLLEAQLDTIRKLALRAKRQAELASLAAAVRDTGFQPDRFAFKDFTLSLSGSLPSKKAQEQLSAIVSPENVALQLVSLRIEPSISSLTSQDLPVIKAKGKGAAKVHIYAVDAEAMWLYSALATGEESLVSTTVRDALLTGHLTASSASKARALLKQEQPGLALSPVHRKSLRGKGPKVTVALTGARLPQVLNMLSDVLGVSIAAPNDASELTINVRNTSAEGLLRAIAKIQKLELQKRPGLLLLTPPTMGKAPKRAGPRIDFAAADITVFEALSLLRAVHPTTATAACGSPKVNLHLANVYHSDAVQALFVNANMAWPPRLDDTCTDVIVHLDTPPQKLVALALTKDRSVALLRNRVGGLSLLEDQTSLPDGTKITINKTGVNVANPGELTAKHLELETKDQSSAQTIRGARLAATMIGHGKPQALLEYSNGYWRLLGDGRQMDDASTTVAIEATKITVSTEGAAPYALHLRRRMRR